MEYTNDVIVSKSYRKDKIVGNVYEKKGKIIKIIKWLKKDSYFFVSSIVSMVALGVDFLIVKKFIELINLL